MKCLLLVSSFLILFITTISSAPITQSQQRQRSLFTKNSDFVFNLKAQASSSGPGGEVRALNVDNFPVLAGLGVSCVLATVEPCAVNLPHVHPRATDLLYLISGRLTVGFVEENGGRFIKNDIKAGEVKI